MKIQRVNKGGNNYTFYEDGRILGPTGKLLKFQKDKDGYLTVHVGGKRQLVHRLIAEVFVPNPNKYPEVDHINGDPADFRAGNLEWVTHHVNVQRAAARGSYSGERNSHNKLKRWQVVEIKERVRGGAKRKDIANEYNVTKSCIDDIMLGRNWKDVV